jgi:uridine kinase
MLTFAEVEERIAAAPKPLLVAIDGLPLAGKSTLAERLIAAFGAPCLWLDDFVRPQAEWPPGEAPAFPFDYIRYGDFLAAVRALAAEGRCRYRTYDWETGRLADQPKTLARGPVTIVEGVSALHPDLAPLYDLRLWVESDPATTLAAARTRGVGDWDREWEHRFLPSVALYLRTDPKARADLIVAGRGAR